MFGGHVERCTHDIAVHRLGQRQIGWIERGSYHLGCQFTVFEDFGQAPIENNYLPKIIQRDIFRFEVTMDYASRVSIRDRLADIEENGKQTMEVDWFSFAGFDSIVILFDCVRQRPFAHKPHGVKRLAGRFVDAVLAKRHNVGVFQVARDLGLAMETLPGLGGTESFGTQLFDRNVSI